MTDENDKKGPYVNLAVGPAGARIEGADGAINAIALLGKPAARCAHMALHRMDLEFALRCVELVERCEDIHGTTAEAFWRSAVVHYCKCFAPPQSASGRAHLSANKIFGREDSQAMKDHRIIMDWRNKHLVHDEGTHNQFAVSAIIDPPGSPRRVRSVLVAALEGVLLTQETLAKLRTLSEAALAHAKQQYDLVANDIAAVLEHTVAPERLATDKTMHIGWNRPGK